MSVLRMADLDLQGKRVLIREDLNVPIKHGKVTSDVRIRAALPTIQLALEKGAKVMVMSHRGRPTEGELSSDDSMAPIAEHLKQLLDAPVRIEPNYLDGVSLTEDEVVLF